MVASNGAGPRRRLSDALDVLAAHPWLSLLASLAGLLLVFPMAQASSGTRLTPGVDCTTGVCVIAAVAYVLLMAIASWLHANGELGWRRACVLLAAAAFVTRGTYVLVTGDLQRQHDVNDLSLMNGHQAYILWFVQNGLKLPTFDPYTVNQFYHPPLHHMIAAAWVCLQRLVGVSLGAAFENIQVLALAYTCGATIISYRLLRALGLEGRALTVPFAIICLHPAFTYMSGYINNDPLCLMLSLAAVLAAVRWYRRPTLGAILVAAAAQGLAMMTKTSGGLVAPVIAVVFVAGFVRARGDRACMAFGQFLPFLLVCVPLALWWPCWCTVVWGEPFMKILEQPVTSLQYLGDLPTSQRLLGIDWDHLSVFENWDFDSGAIEWNPAVALLKTSMFDEATLATSGWRLLACTVLFWSNVGLVVVSLACAVVSTVRLVLRRYVAPHPLGVACAALLFWELLAFFYRISFTEPFCCTMSFRYIVPSVVAGAGLIGVSIARAADGRWWVRLVRVLTAAFCAASALSYLGLGLAGVL
ncbi:MAG: hypothetical protein LKI25_04640 [Atopobiaceae bacterium]|jgi:4-amino-4-deoxy-L-arabinose transferase-like glycosyltransferase|nr:hypothetical protein [Atopobiaceae bacterium]MCI2173496.1 hypothetical protein [Atopobiaceae bacterium]